MGAYLAGVLVVIRAEEGFPPPRILPTALPLRSISQLKTYTRCGRLYYLEKIQRLGEFPAAWTALGTAFHESYHQWELSGRATDWVAEFTTQYDELIEIGWQQQPNKNLWGKPPGMALETSIKHYRKRGIEKDVPQYKQRCEEAAWEVAGLEVPFDISLSGSRVRGAIDRLQVYPGSGQYSIEDLKTGSPDEEDDTRQIEFYGWVANEYLDYPVDSVRYWFTKLNRPGPWINLTKGRDYWEHQFEMLNDGIEEGVFLPNPGKKCGLCSVKPWCPSQTANVDMSTAPRKP